MQTKRFLVAVIATIALSAQSFAQGQLKELSTLGGDGIDDITFIPPSFSYDGKTYIGITEYDPNVGKVPISYTIKDLEGNDVKKLDHQMLFSYNAYEYYYPVSSDTVIEYSDIDYGPAHEPLSGKYSRDLYQYLDSLLYAYYVFDSYLQYSSPIFFTTLDGRDAFCLCLPDSLYPRYYGPGYDYDYDFYNYDLYGKQYPYRFYAIGDDGYVNEYNVDYELQTKNFKFSDIPTKSSTYDRSIILDFYVKNLSTQGGDIDGYYATQTLFNDDPNWEYWNLTWDSSITEDRISYYYNYDLDLESPVRILRYSAYLKNISLVNDKGETLLEIPIEQRDGFQIEYEPDIQYVRTEGKDLIVVSITYYSIDNGKDGAIYYTTLYSYDRGLSAVKAIARTESTRMSVNVTDSQVNVSVDNADKAESVSLSDMTGRVVGRIPATSSGSSINTSKMSKGVYNITLQGAGNIENQKILIK